MIRFRVDFYITPPFQYKIGFTDRKILRDHRKFLESRFPQEFWIHAPPTEISIPGKVKDMDCMVEIKRRVFKHHFLHISKSVKGIIYTPYIFHFYLPEKETS